MFRSTPFVKVDSDIFIYLLILLHYTQGKWKICTISLLKTYYFQLSKIFKAYSCHKYILVINMNCWKNAEICQAWFMIKALIEIKLSTQRYFSCQIHFILQISIGLLNKNHKLELFWLNYTDQCNEKNCNNCNHMCCITANQKDSYKWMVNYT